MSTQEQEQMRARVKRVLAIADRWLGLLEADLELRESKAAQELGATGAKPGDLVSAVNAIAGASKLQAQLDGVPETPSLEELDALGVFSTAAPTAPPSALPHT